MGRVASLRRFAYFLYEFQQPVETVYADISVMAVSTVSTPSSGSWVQHFTNGFASIPQTIYTTI